MTDINKQIEEEAEKCMKGLSPCVQQKLTMEGKYYWWHHFKDGFIKGYNACLHSSRWRKVSEELPEMGYRVLVRNEFKVSHLGYIDTVGDWRYCLNNELIKDKLLEWKPID